MTDRPDSDPVTLAPEDAKLVTLARATRARTQAPAGAAVRDLDGRTYAAAQVDLPSVRVGALELAVAMAVSSGARGLEAALVVADDLPDVAPVRDLAGVGVPVLLADPPAGRRQDDHMSFRSGFACFVGRPNAGKSTLTNALVGEKVAITSSKPQTTRHAIRGLVHRPDAQLVLVDTPGLHRPRNTLGQRLNDIVRTTWAEVDTIAMCFPADQKIGPGDRFLVAELARIRRAPVLAVVTKTDLVAPERVGQQLMAVQEAGRAAGLEWREIVPVSAVNGDQVGLLSDLLVATLPEGPALYPEGQLTDEPETTLVAEIVREAALEGVHDELPHSIAVVVDEMTPREDRPADRPLLDVRVNVYVERDSQKGIVIGRKGARLKEIGTTSRGQIERLLGTPVHLDLHVKVAKDWQRDPKQLRKLGF